MTQTIEQLTARIAELEEENARLKREKVDFAYGFEFFRNETKRHESELSKQLAASQAYAEQLREALSSVEWEDFHFDRHGNGQQHCPGCGNQKSVGRHTIQCPIGKALSLPRDTSVLDAYVAKKVKEAMK